MWFKWSAMDLFDEIVFKKKFYLEKFLVAIQEKF
jgi:hypothetical protein